jgi:hypothetical protein
MAKSHPSVTITRVARAIQVIIFPTRIKQRGLPTPNNVGNIWISFFFLSLSVVAVLVTSHLTMTTKVNPYKAFFFFFFCKFKSINGYTCFFCSRRSGSSIIEIIKSATDKTGAWIWMELMELESTTTASGTHCKNVRRPENRRRLSPLQCVSVFIQGCCTVN